MSIKVQKIDSPTDEMIEAVNSELRSHNQKENPSWFEKIVQNKNKPTPLKLFAFNDQEQVIGGLFGSIQFNWLKVDVMSVCQEYRDQGVGKSLLDQAESCGIDEGCKYSYVDTMNHQAPEFYKKRGYEIVGEISDWDSHGHTKYFFVKNL